MRIVDTAPERIVEVGYRRARAGGGTETAWLPVDVVRVDRLPAGCDAVVVTGDLQGVSPSPWGGEATLLGIALADYLTVWAQAGLLPPPERVGVLLAGDLYSAPGADARGVSGPVDDVWWAFAAAGCPFVLGVAGNHDVVTSADLADLGPDVVLFDGDCVDRGGVRFGGVGRVIGASSRPGRREEAAQLDLVTRVLHEAPDVLILHQGPPGRRPDQFGHPALADRIAQTPPALVVCGHVHWPVPVSPLPSSPSGHVLNVDGRVVVLRTATPGPEPSSRPSREPSVRSG
nr:metallophosphoesterase [Streptomyces sp. SID3343]